jgi:hypothetical protein
MRSGDESSILECKFNPWHEHNFSPQGAINLLFLSCDESSLLVCKFNPWHEYDCSLKEQLSFVCFQVMRAACLGANSTRGVSTTAPPRRAIKILMRSGDESSLLECKFNPWHEHDCSPRIS